MTGYLSTEQVDQLLAPINPARVLARDGMAYVAVHDVKAHLTRIFGFGRWSSEVIEQELIFEEPKTKKNGKDGWYVCYRSVVRLTVCAPDGTVLATYTEGHVGDNTGPTRGDVHGNAVANSESYALKRCAAMLGDQFGLSLYDKGSKRPLVKGTLVHPETPSDDVNGDAVQSEGLDEGRPTESDPEPAAAAPAPPLISPAPGEPEAPGHPDGLPSPEANVGEFRARVIDVMSLPRREATIQFAKLKAEIAKAGVASVMTTTPGGSPLTLGALVDQALDYVTAKTHGNAHADAAAGEHAEVLA